MSPIPSCEVDPVGIKTVLGEYQQKDVDEDKARIVMDYVAAALNPTEEGANFYRLFDVLQGRTYTATGRGPGGKTWERNHLVLAIKQTVDGMSDATRSLIDGNLPREMRLKTRQTVTVGIEYAPGNKPLVVIIDMFTPDIDANVSSGA